jgi:DNA-binding MarR family transcriptional regulator
MGTWINKMKDASDSRGRIIHLLEKALAFADEINDGDTGYAIERALDVVRAQAFKPFVPATMSGKKD